MTTAQRSTQHETLKKAFLKIEELQQRLLLAEQGNRQPIAIIGIACRLPGGVRNLEDYWRLLREGRSAITDIPNDRWDVASLYDPNPQAVGKMYCCRGGFLEGVDQFDPQFFGISPREVLHMDPQQRILLEVTWEALERAGVAPDTLAGTKTGVFTGVGFNDYGRLLGELDLSEMNAYTGPGTQICFASGRVSYTLGLRGPSVPVDTACSSSLVAVHLGCQSLRQRESDVVLAGGVNLVLMPEGNVWLSRAGALAPDGHCKTFDASANGFVRGEGCAVLVLKRLDDAIRDGNHVLAVIRGSAVNHDGRSSGLTVPSGPAQEALLRQALANADLRPEEVSYLEAHGTGTSLGDPIELGAILSVLGKGSQGPRTTPLTVGSAKTNFGHLEAASGVAGLVKVVLMLQHRQIAPHLHFKELNPAVSLNGVELSVPTELREWSVEGAGTRVAGVSSFGLSGTNAHVLLEEAPRPAPAHEANAASPGDDGHFLLLPISATKSEALRSLVEAYGQFLGATEASLADIAFTAAVGRNHLDHRVVVTAESPRAAAEAISGYLGGAPSPAVISGRRPLTGAPKIAFVCPDEAALTPQQLARALSELLPRSAAFREAFEACDALFRGLGYEPLAGALAGTETGPAIRAAHFAFQAALAALWRSWGIQPDAIVGLRIGEVVAAHVADALSLDDAVRLVHEGAACNLYPRAGTIPLSSTTDGRFCDGSELDRAYWQRNAKQTPDLTLALKALIRDECRVFLELMPSFAFAGTIQRALDLLTEQASVVSVPAGSTPGHRAVLSALGQLYCFGHSPNWRVVYASGQIVPTLPSYPWQCQRYWIEAKAKPDSFRSGKRHPLLGHTLPPAAARPDSLSWEMDLGGDLASALPTQLFAGQRRVSAATFTRLALAAAKETFGSDTATVANLELVHPLLVSHHQRSVVQISVSSDELGHWVLQVHSRSAAPSRDWVLHATARLAKG